MRNIFLKKSYTKSGREASLKLFYKKSKLSKYLWINNLKCYEVYFYCMSKSRSIKIY